VPLEKHKKPDELKKKKQRKTEKAFLINREKPPENTPLSVGNEEKKEEL